MSPRLSRILFGTAVLVWSGVMLYFYASGRINKYLAPDFRLLSMLGGLGLGVLGLFNILTSGANTTCGHDHGPGEDHHHDHQSSDLHPLVALVLMLVPIGLSTAWTKDEYSPAALARKGAYDSPSENVFLASALPPLTRESVEQNHIKSPAGYYQFSLMELFFATGDRDYQSVIDGMKIETEGRLIDEKNNNSNGTRRRLYRLFITCCVADSRAIPIIAEFNAEPPDIPENDWVRISGTMTYPKENGELHPVLQVEDISPADPPYEESFLRN